MNKASLFLASLAFAALSACSLDTGGSNAAQDAPLAGARIGGPFTLTDQDGKQVSWDSFKGKYRIVYFGYSYCPDVCPLDLQKIMQAFTQFEKQKPALAAKVQPIFITLDPERDTAPVIKAYVAAFHPRLMGLTGTPEQIAKVAKAFAVIYSREGTGKNYLVSHSRTPYLFGADGNPIALIPVGDAAGGPSDTVLATLDQWVK